MWLDQTSLDHYLGERAECVERRGMEIHNLYGFNIVQVRFVVNAEVVVAAAIQPWTGWGQEYCPLTWNHFI